GCQNAQCQGAKQRVVSNRFHDEPPYVRYQANPRVAFTLKCANRRCKLSSKLKTWWDCENKHTAHKNDKIGVTDPVDLNLC
ncbi:MAG: hypothetical protein WB579_25490, partial [Bryobacteraceae bacterium]